MSYPFNALNRGVYIADNLAFLRQINDESVDLVNIDPPFGKSKTWPAGKVQAAAHAGRAGQRDAAAGVVGHRDAATSYGRGFGMASRLAAEGRLQ